MKLLLIYGPPGVGKLTVAKELAKLTGFPLFHNHLTVDLVASIFPMGTKIYSDLVKEIRLDLIEAAAKNRVKGMIFTFVYGVETYGGGEDDKFIKNIIDRIRRFKGRVFFVKLTCNEKELRRRLKHPSRKSFGKIRKIKTLRSIGKDYNLDATVPFGKSLIIDNTKLPPKRAARIIKNHLTA